MPAQYRVLVPKTRFPVRTNPVTHEPAIQKAAKFDDLYGWQERQQRGDDKIFTLHDGPPYANGAPHMGHVLNRVLKDVINRYKLMRGYKLAFRPGWDCHGLPAELEAEQELGISGRVAIADYGVERFNEYCRTSVLRYTEAWQESVTRQARWVDFKHDYKTMDLSYMESIIWAFKQLWDKDLIYEGYRVMPYSWAAQTPLSNFETRLDDSYRERQDPAL